MRNRSVFLAMGGLVALSLVAGLLVFYLGASPEASASSPPDIQIGQASSEGTQTLQELQSTETQASTTSTLSAAAGESGHTTVVTGGIRVQQGSGYRGGVGTGTMGGQGSASTGLGSKQGRTPGSGTTTNPGE
jgi:hypothetical protein